MMLRQCTSGKQPSCFGPATHRTAGTCSQANGVGGSWWAEQFCAGTDNRALNVVLTELESTLAL